MQSVAIVFVPAVVPDRSELCIAAHNISNRVLEIPGKIVKIVQIRNVLERLEMILEILKKFEEIYGNL